MRISKILLFIFLVIVTLNVKAQKDTSNPNNSNHVTVFENTPTTYAQQRQVVKQKTVIKLNPFLFFDGDIPVYIEEVFTNSFSVEVAPGLTYDNYSQDLNEEGSLFDALPYIQNTTPGIGYSFKADIKYFPGTNNVLNGIYLSPEIGYRHYVINYPTGQNSTTGLDTYETGHTNKTDLKLLLGHEAESNWVDNLFFDWYLGIGLRSTSALQYIADSNTGVISPSSSSFTRPSFYAGIKIGIGF